MAHQLRDGGREALLGFAEELSGSPQLTTRSTNMKSRTNDLTRQIMKCQTVRRNELRRLVPLSDTTIYELEQRGEFPKRFYLTPRCVVWPLEEILLWVDERRAACENGTANLAPHPDFRLRGVNR